MNPPRIVLVAAMGRNRVIGMDGQMPWHLPADLAHFKRLTLGKPVIMGRRTFEAIGGPLPGRTNIVLSRGEVELPEGVLRTKDLDEALDLCNGAEQAMVIGGGQVYAEALPRASAMELTFVDAEPGGDTHFPEWDPREWSLKSTEAREPDEKNPFRLVFCRFERSGG